MKRDFTYIQLALALYRSCHKRYPVPITSPWPTGSKADLAFFDGGILLPLRGRKSPEEVAAHALGMMGAPKWLRRLRRSRAAKTCR